MTISSLLDEFDRLDRLETEHNRAARTARQERDQVQAQIWAAVRDLSDNPNILHKGQVWYFENTVAAIQLRRGPIIPAASITTEPYHATAPAT